MYLNHGRRNYLVSFYARNFYNSYVLCNVMDNIQNLSVERLIVGMIGNC
jgi:hypothetical protein